MSVTTMKNKSTTVCENKGHISVGIDIGTTTISGVVYDIESKNQIEAYSIPHNSYVQSDIYSEQNALLIIEKTENLLYSILDTYQNVISIGITGQMHGIVYVDDDGKIVSNLMNWQDKRADIPLENGKTTCQLIEEITKEKISTGYGIATHCYNLTNKNVPQTAVGFCSIMDAFCMKICGLKKAITHTSVGASFGLFDIEKGKFMEDKLSLLGIDLSFLPNVTDESVVVGSCRNISVSIPIGDNQASFLGSVQNNSDSILVNVGTGSQVSMVSHYCESNPEIEIRPFIEGKYLICGSALCGGFAYSMLENFFRSYVVSMGMEDKKQYDVINRLATEGYENNEKGLNVEPFFCGKRSDPNVRGSINMIDRQNFTPTNLILGILNGMCDELYELYELFPKKRTVAVASGGGIKKNETLKKIISKRFNTEVLTIQFKEEAAVGVALFSAFAIKKIEYVDGFSNYLKYE